MLRKLGTAMVLALATTLTTLSVPQAASADDKATGAPNNHVTYWVEENPPPPSEMALKAAAELQKSITPQASGGGCKDAQGVGICISWTNNQLK